MEAVVRVWWIRWASWSELLQPLEVAAANNNATKGEAMGYF